MLSDSRKNVILRYSEGSLVLEHGRTRRARGAALNETPGGAIRLPIPD
jgi:hypothetical protein